MSRSAPPIRGPQILNLDGYIHVLRDVLASVGMGASSVTLDLAPVARAYPDGVLPLIAALMRVRWVNKIEVEVLPPTDQPLRGVFDGVGWSHFLTTSHPDFRPPPVNNRQFTPATPFSTARELEAVRKSIMQVVLSHSRLASWLPEAIEWSLWEVMENVLNHSGTGMGWVQASTFSKTRHVNIVVVDSGVGICGSLSKRFGSLGDQQALKKAVEEGGTRDPERNAGYGLTGCSRIALSNRGELIVQSGEYRLTVEPGSARSGDVYRYSRQDASHVGTIVELELRTNRPVDPTQAFPQSPMPLIELQPGTEEEYVFDIEAEASNLGTREAGRELRNRVLNLAQGDDEGRIALDFGRVSMLSSSFADELVARLAEELGKRDFFQRYELRGMNQAVKTIVDTVLWARL